MRKALAVFFLVVAMPTCAADLVRDERLFVSMYRLLAVPKAYEGKKVVLNGYLHVDDQSGVLFVNETAQKYGPQMDSVYVRLTPEQAKKYQSFNEKWVLIEGTFTHPQNENVPDFAGVLDRIVRVKRMDGEE